MSYLLVQARPELLARPLYAVRYKNIWLNIGHVYYSCRSLPASVDMAETSFTSGILFDGEEEAEEEDDDYNISDQQIRRISRPFAKPSSDIVMPAERSRSVMEAFHLLQTNPKVQVCLCVNNSFTQLWKEWVEPSTVACAMLHLLAS